MRKRNIKSIAHWSIMSVLLLFPVLMVGISAFQNADYQPEEVKTYYDLDALDIGQTYYLQTPIVTTLNTEDSEGFLAVTDLTVDGTDYDTANKLRFYYTTRYATMYAYQDNTSVMNGISLTNGTHLLTFTYQGPLSNSSYFEIFNGSYYTVELIDNYHYKNDVNYWVNSFINLPVNSWYKSLMNVMGVGFTNSSVMNVIYVMPLYILWVYILDLIVDCLLVIINFGHDALQRLGADNE